MSDHFRLLVVADSEAARRVFVAHLREQGHWTEAVSDGAAALKQVAAVHYDAVLLDGEMQGVSGMEVLDQIRTLEFVTRTPVVMVTANPDSVTVIEALNRGASDYVVKPVQFPVLFARLETLFARRRAELENARLRQELEDEVARRTEALQQALHHLEINEERFQSLAMGAPVGIFRTDAEGRCVYVNRRWCAIASLSLEQALGEEWGQAIHPEDRERTLKAWEEAVSAGRPFRGEYRFAAEDGRATWVLGQADPERDRAGQLVGFVGSITDIDERHRAEAELLASRQLLQTVIDTFPFLVSVRDREGRFQLTNAALAKLYGVPARDMIGQSIQAVVSRTPGLIEKNSAAVARVVDADRQVLRTGRPLENEQYSTQDLQAVKSTWRRSVFPLTGPQGEIAGVVAWSEDVTELLRTEADLRASRELLQTVVDTFPFWVAVRDPEGRFQLVNAALAKDLYGVPPAELIGRTALENMARAGHDVSAYRAVLERLEKLYKEVMETGKLREVPYYDAPLRDGSLSKRRQLVFPLADPEGGARGVVSWSEDVTERMKTQAIRERSERVMAQAEQIAHLGAMEWNLGTGEQYWSDGLFRLMGHEPQSLPANASTFASFLHPEDKKRVLAEMSDASAARRRVDLQCRVVRRDGAVRTVHARGEIAADPSGGGDRMVGTVHDITDRLRTEHVLGQAMKLEALGRLTGSVTHDFNNVLQIALGFAQVVRHQLAALEGGGDTRARIESSLHQIVQALEQGSNLTRQLLAFARGSDLKPRPVDLNGHVRGRLDILRMAVTKRIELEFRPADLPGPVLADPGMLDQVLLNLSINARDAMAQGGRLRLTTGRLTVGKGDLERLALDAPGEYAVLTVEDTGHGMSREVQARIFEPFFSTKGDGRGTGLGLSVVHGIVRQHKGQIAVESEAGRGTTFRIYWPATSSSPMST